MGQPKDPQKYELYIERLRNALLKHHKEHPETGRKISKTKTGSKYLNFPKKGKLSEKNIIGLRKAQKKRFENPEE